MIDFEEELKNFQPSMEIKEAEKEIQNRDLTDMTDILRQLAQIGNNQSRRWEQ
ncbi:MAG: hypothetical protein II765_06125 [Lachnospiraceae bacterium]|jgi:hypothetical protein|nr:hypothetical protein [Lachnospiraceae bacterium]